MPKEFKAAPWGGRVWGVTLFVCGLFLAMILAAVFVFSEMPWPLRALIAGSASGILGVTALFIVKGYVLDRGSLLVRRAFWSTRVDLGGLKSAVADASACERAWKTAGNDGLFAMHGWFYSKRLGSFRAFVTNPAFAVILEFGTKRVVISPEDPAAFVAAVVPDSCRA